MFPKKIIGKYLGDEVNGILIGKVNFCPRTYVECNVTEEMFKEIESLCSQGLFYLFEFASINKVKEITNELETRINESLNIIVEEIAIVEGNVSKLLDRMVTAEGNISNVAERVDLAEEDINSLIERIKLSEDTSLKTEDRINALEENTANLFTGLSSKYDNALLEDGLLSFYAGETLITSITLPLPDDPKLIELSKNDTHIIWRYKTVGEEENVWYDLVPLIDITGPRGLPGEIYDDTELRELMSDMNLRLDKLDQVPIE